MDVGNSHHGDKSAAPAEDNADLSNIQASWSRVWEAQKDQFSKAGSLAAAEFQLSVKAILLSAICILIMVGIGLIIWTSILLTVAYAAINVGLHWAVIAALFIVLNLLMFWVISRIFKDATKSIGLGTTIHTLFKDEPSDPSPQQD